MIYSIETTFVPEWDVRLYIIDIVEENGKLLCKTSAGNCEELYM